MIEKLTLKFLAILLLFTISLNAYSQKYTFVHLVNSGETISSIAQKYNTNIETIKLYNPDLNINRISINQSIVIPTFREPEYLEKEYGIPPNRVHLILKGQDEPLIFDQDIIPEATEAKQEVIKNNQPFKRKPPVKQTEVFNKNETVINQQDDNYVKHYVKTGETLFSLSKQYNVPVDSIKAWNNLEGNFLPVSEYIIIGRKGVTYYSHQTPKTEQHLHTVKTFEEAEKLKDGQVHIVKQHETLYSLSKVYNISVEELKLINQIEDDNIQIGQIIFLKNTPTPNHQPINEVVEVFEPTVTEKPTITEPVVIENNTTRPPISYTDMQAVYHEVQTSETLYHIAKQYNKSIEQLQQWNNLTLDSHIEAGDKIIVGYFKETGTANQYNEASTYGQSQKYQRIYDIKQKRSDAYHLIKENGIASWIPKSGAADDNLYVLHKTAPTQSIIRVVNPMNKKVVYVKVIGQLQNKIGEEDIEMKLTAEAVKRLQLLDDRFRLEWSYHVVK